jgi:hypothetical protein
VTSNGHRDEPKELIPEMYIELRVHLPFDAGVWDIVSQIMRSTSTVGGEVHQRTVVSPTGPVPAVGQVVGDDPLLHQGMTGSSPPKRTRAT